MFVIKTTYQFLKVSFVAPSISARRSSNIFQKNLDYLKKTFYPNRFLLLTSKSLQRNRCRNCNTLHKKKTLSSLKRDCKLPIFTANETITNLTQYELPQNESDLIKGGLYFLIQPDKIQKSEIFTTFEKIHCLFLNNLKS